MGIYLINTSPNVVFSIRPFTIRLSSGSLDFSSSAVMIGVLIDFEALMISFIRGTPCVICVMELS